MKIHAKHETKKKKTLVKRNKFKDDMKIKSMLTKIVSSEFENQYPEMCKESVLFLNDNNIIVF